ncbi:MAG: hypothetical protein ACFFAK_05675 [Promethearchaeota archaeon]
MKSPKGYILIISLLLLSNFNLKQLILSSNYSDSIDIDLENEDSWSVLIKPNESPAFPILKTINDSFYIGYSIYSSDIAYVAKYDESGTNLWENRLTDVDLLDFNFDSKSNLYVLAKLIDRNYILLKFNILRELLWSKILDSGYEIYSFKVDLNDSIYISGTNYTNPKAFLLKFNPSGNLVWNKTLDAYNKTNFAKIEIDSNNCVYLCGSRYLFKYNSSGSMIWYKQLDITARFYGLKVYSDENIIVNGYTELPDHKYDLWLLKLNSLGNITYQTNFLNNTGHNSLQNFQIFFFDNIYIYTDIPLIREGNYIIYSEQFLLKFDPNLSFCWNFSLADYNVRWGAYVTPLSLDIGVTSHQDICIIYNTYRESGDIGVLKLNSSGQIITNYFWGGSYYDYINAIAIDSQDNFYMLCTCEYVTDWNIHEDRIVFVKNPKPNGKPPPYQQIDYRDIYIFSFLGITSIISIIAIIFILRVSKSRNSESQ